MNAKKPQLNPALKLVLDLGPHAQQIDVLCHARFTDVGVDGLRTEEHRVLSASEELQDRAMNRC